jgi:hypothetical protein
MGLGLYSFAIFAAMMWLVMGYFLLRLRKFPAWSRAAAWAGTGIVLFGVWLAIRPTATPGVETVDDTASLIGNGKPTVIEFFSDT